MTSMNYKKIIKYFFPLLLILAGLAVVLLLLVLPLKNELENTKKEISKQKNLVQDRTMAVSQIQQEISEIKKEQRRKRQRLNKAKAELEQIEKSFDQYGIYSLPEESPYEEAIEGLPATLNRIARQEVLEQVDVEVLDIQEKGGLSFVTARVEGVTGLKGVRSLMVNFLEQDYVHGVQQVKIRQYEQSKYVQLILLIKVKT